MKHCPRCNKDLEESAFTRSPTTNKLASYCKQCMKEYDEARKETKRIKDMEYKLKHKEQYKAYYKKYQENNRERIKQLRKDYRQQNLEQILEYQRKHYWQNREKYLEYKRKEREEKGEEIKARQRIWYANNKERLAELRNNPNYKINHAISLGIYYSLKENKLEQHWEDLVPYTLQELKEHLESQFDENMTWDNYGSYWEVDHIIPKSLFNFTSYEDREFKICWSLMNLRPLEKIANRSRPKDGSDISEKLKQQILNQDFSLHNNGT